ncbi:MAG: hypothetical protein ACKOW2_04495 [Sphingobacteriaceae bacterium]
MAQFSFIEFIGVALLCFFFGILTGGISISHDYDIDVSKGNIIKINEKIYTCSQRELK